MSALLVLANHSSDHWAVNALLFLAPVIVLAVLLAVWSRRKPERIDDDGAAEAPSSDDGDF